jgi:hypothetical protein
VVSIAANELPLNELLMGNVLVGVDFSPDVILMGELVCSPLLLAATLLPDLLLLLLVLFEAFC